MTREKELVIYTTAIIREVHMGAFGAARLVAGFVREVDERKEPVSEVRNERPHREKRAG